MLGRSMFEAVAMPRTVASLTLGAIVALAMSGAANAAPSCSSPITKCGCSITTGGLYVVNTNLSQIGSGVCIDIQAPNTILEFTNTSARRPATIEGSGAGTGIWIESSAKNTVVSGVQNKNGLPGLLQSVAANADEASITLFKYAIEDDADNTVVSFFNKLNENTAGVYLNSVTNVTLGNFCADNNTVAGVLVVNTTNSRIFDFTAEKNRLDGILMAGSTNNVLYNLTAVYNAQDGILLQDSSGNSVSPASAGSNGANGIHIGCGSTPIPCTSTSESNHIVGNAVEGTFSGDVSNCDGRMNMKQPVGIHIETTGSANTIASNKTRGNTKWDLLDDNSDCDSNIWTNNTFTSAAKISPSCTGAQ